MKLIALAPHDIFLPTSFTSALVDGVGQPDFAAHLLRAFETRIPASHCTAFALNDAGRVMAIATASARGEAATVTAQDYMRLGFDTKDSNMLWLMRQRRPRQPRAWLSHQTAEEVADLEYRQVCYGDNGIRERLSALFMRPDGQRIAVSLYRGFALDPFGEPDFAVLSGCADFLLAAVRAHTRQASGSAVRGEAQRLLLSRLAHRERQVIVSALSGKTTKETAQELGLSPATALTYRYRAFTKMGVRTHRELMAVLTRGA